MSSNRKKSARERTSVQNLLRNRQSGHYYGRFTIAGKQKWHALETDVLSVAKLRLADKAAEVERLRGMAGNVKAGKATVHDLIEAYRARTQTNADIKPATVAARLGHNDGGVLAMKTYGHLRPAHSLAAAQKVKFSHAPVAK